VKFNFKGIAELGELQKDEMTGMFSWHGPPLAGKN